MKKIIAMILALVMCLSLSAAAFAEAEVTVIDWADVAESISEDDGEFYALDDIGLIFWIPYGLDLVEAPDDGNTYLAFFLTEEEDYCLGISVTDPVEGLDHDSFCAALAEAESVEGLEEVVVNGLACLSYTIANGDSASNTLSIVLDDGSVLSFIFGTENEEYDAVSRIIASSIQVAE